MVFLLHICSGWANAQLANAHQSCALAREYCNKYDVTPPPYF
jgi:hypothetical protein